MLYQGLSSLLVQIGRFLGGLFFLSGRKKERKKTHRHTQLQYLLGAWGQKIEGGLVLVMTFGIRSVPRLRNLRKGLQFHLSLDF